ncbi:hypothetical protein [Marimonas arenosa]|uniref:Uncharacterized protein n=1 Tax=Marimonas arenosa TaxID=1795305 RepID=A0AAE3WI73_9RHOB|nr:hypothetical protein [Marimonas arenosa]MDQ2092110.1 hypothetical protein [Marimonas arenosa]
MAQIEFLCPPELHGHIPEPQPAARFLPEWYRDLPREMGMPDAHGLPGLTVRACLPVADVMALGWIIPLPFDVWTVFDPAARQMDFRWDPSCPFNPIEPHHPGQIGADQPGPFEGAQPLKFLNPWRVKSPPGWSASFLHPVNHFELPFHAFAGSVDCDALDVPVNVPFLWTAPPRALRLPAGTPMVQVIPYERAAQIREAMARPETPDEVAARAAASSRKHAEESVYAREWRRRHERGS